MPYQRKGTSNWWISYYDPRTGKQTQRSAGPDFKEAKAIEQQLRSEAHRDKAKHRGDVALDTVIAEYLTTHLNPQAKSTARHLLHLASGWAGDLSQATLRTHIKRRQAEGAAPATINKELVMLSAAINAYNLDHGTTLPNPVPGLKLREPEGRLRYLSPSEYAALVAECDGYLKGLVILATNTGLRKGELFGLRWTDIDLDRRMLTLRADSTKSGKSRSIPLNNEALTVLNSLKGHALVFHGVKDMRRSFATACKRAGLTDIGLHTLRHTFASWLVIGGTSLYEVQKLLGHASPTMTQRYAHLSPDHLRSAVDGLSTVVDSVLVADDDSQATRVRRAG